MHPPIISNLMDLLGGMQFARHLALVLARSSSLKPLFLTRKHLQKIRLSKDEESPMLCILNFQVTDLWSFPLLIANRLIFASSSPVEINPRSPMASLAPARIVEPPKTNRIHAKPRIRNIMKNTGNLKLSPAFSGVTVSCAESW